MNIFLRIASALLFVAVITTAVPVHAASKTKAVAPKDPIAEATVNIICRVKLGGASYLTTGSGVFINDKGVILTNAHVGQYHLLTEGTGKSKVNCSVRTGSPARDQYVASLIYISPKWLDSYISSVANKSEGSGSSQRDFALLQVTKAKKGDLPAHFPFVPLASLETVNSLTAGETVAITGYPAENLDYKEVDKKLATLTATTTISEIRSFDRPYSDVLFLAPSKAGQSGISGAPVTYAGSVVGIAATLSNEKVKKLKGLRALSLPYIDRMVRADVGIPFSSLYSGDIAERTRLTLASLPTDIRKTLETTLRRNR